MVPAMARCSLAGCFCVAIDQAGRHAVPYLACRRCEPHLPATRGGQPAASCETILLRPVPPRLGFRCGCLRAADSELSRVLTAPVSAVSFCDYPSASGVPTRFVPSKPPPAAPLEAVLTGRNGPGCARTIANRDGTSLTGAARTWRYGSVERMPCHGRSTANPANHGAAELVECVGHCTGWVAVPA